MHAMVQNHGDFHCSYDYKVHDCFFSDLYPGEVSKYPITTASKSKKKKHLLVPIKQVFSTLLIVSSEKASCSKGTSWEARIIIVRKHRRSELCTA